MDASEVLAKCHKQGITLKLDGSRLHYEAPEGAMTKEMRSLLIEQKKALLEHLRSLTSEHKVNIPSMFTECSPEKGACNQIVGEHSEHSEHFPYPKDFFEIVRLRNRKNINTTGVGFSSPCSPLHDQGQLKHEKKQELNRSEHNDEHKSPCSLSKDCIQKVICRNCRYLVPFPCKIPEHVNEDTFRKCNLKDQGRFPMQSACESHISLENSAEGEIHE